MKEKIVCRHLGAPFGLKVTKAQKIQYCLDKIQNRLDSWENRYLTFEAKVILLKHVIQALPVFLMSIIGITETAARDIEKLGRKFLWGTNEEGRSKTALVSWDKMCQPIQLGGLGLKEVRAQGKALLCKRMGDILDDKDVPWIHTLSAYVISSRSWYDRAVVKRNYSLSDLILTNQRLHVHESDSATALIRPHYCWTLEDENIPSVITLRDTVNLALEEEGTDIKEMKEAVARLRELKITTTTVLWQRRRKMWDLITDSAGSSQRDDAPLSKYANRDRHE